MECSRASFECDASVLHPARHVAEALCVLEASRVVLLLRGQPKGVTKKWDVTYFVAHQAVRGVGSRLG